VAHTATSAENCNVPRSPQQLRGLNQNHNHAMKEILKGAATGASCGAGPLRDLHAALLAKGMKPDMARLTLPLHGVRVPQP
jgi:hypothetical protein